IGVIDSVLSLGLPRPVSFVFLYLVGFYILMLSLRIRPLLGAVGSIAFAFSSYYFIIIEAGHNTKAHAIAYMAPLLAGVIWTYRGKFLLGGVVTALFMALQLSANHVQITYYFGFLLIAYGIAKLVDAAKSNALPSFFKASGIIVAAVIIGVMANINVLWNTYEYGKYTTRGETELTITPDGESNADNTTAGLDRDYVTQWSYGIGESISFLIPNARGGESGVIGNDPGLLSDVDRSVQQSIAQSNAYWGDQPFTSGPVYMGAIVVLLFLLGAFFVKGPIKWALVAVAALTIALSWGKNMMGLTDFFLDYIPGYNKFRAVTIILAITEFVFPLLGIIFVKKLIDNPDLIVEQKKKFFAVGGGLLALVILFLAIPDAFFDFLSDAEKNMLNSRMGEDGGAQVLSYAEGLKSARSAIFTADALRTLAFLAVGLVAIWLYAKRTIKANVFILILGVFILVDLWTVDKRYLSNEKDRGKYVQWEDPSRKGQAYEVQAADEYILEAELELNPRVYDAVEEAANEVKSNAKKGPLRKVSQGEVTDAKFAALRFNTNYRVLPLSGTYQDSRTAYFHKSIGGYHGAKLKRIQELYNFHMEPEITKLTDALQSDPTPESVNGVLRSSDVLNMLNTKYIIYNPKAPPLANTYNHGSVWFVEDMVMADDADAEIQELGKIDTRYEAVVDKRFAEQVKGFNYSDAADAAIAVETHLPNYIKYIYDSPVEQAAIFSEIYYDAGWQAYVDGEPAPHFRANYVLRGMILPAGEHAIEFKFEPQTYAVASTISTIAQVLLILLLGWFVFTSLRKTGREETSGDV
ncbi:MAG: YfhO family protein, partial [Cryomorphaceae bacterium]